MFIQGSRKKLVTFARPRSISFRCYVCVDDMGDRHVKFGGCSYGPTCYVTKKDFLWNAMRIGLGVPGCNFYTCKKTNMYFFVKK